jgi:N-6 DNA Methylase
MPDPRRESLDEIVSHSAVVLADQIQRAAAWAKSEMDLQIEVAGALKEFARKAKITLEVHHNITVATGRPDSVYSNVIVEYKDPGSLSANRDAANNKKLIEQIRQRFYDMRREENRSMSSMFGVGTDGRYFVFVRFRDEKWTDQEPLEVNRHSTERFLWALYNLGQKGKPYQPEYLHGDFGSESQIAQDGIGVLYDQILKTENPRADVFFSQWKILFGEVCGYNVDNLSDRLRKLAEFYQMKDKPRPAQLLFAVHTYYAVLIKLVAAEIVSFFNPWMPRQVEKLQNATTSAKLKRELEQLESGGIFHEMGITNFLEGDLFSWYLAVWDEPIELLNRKIISKLDEYNPGTFSEDPAQSRDLLKKLYQQLFPKAVRHDLGEYYTPDWLADHVLNELNYEGNPDKRFLDPACGSGTFLVMAINRIRHWYENNRERCSYDESELVKKILSNVIGFDLNPLAVMAARTNYLVAIKDLIRHTDHVEIPVYLCDSIVTPSEYRDLFSRDGGKVAKVPCSAMKPPYLLVPKEIAHSPTEVARYAEVLETCVKRGAEPSEFLSRCKDEGLTIAATDEHISLYEELVQLENDPKGSKNGIWARIIKNSFAPLFQGRESFDFIAGNPPWVNWEALPTEYRSASQPIWEHYSLVGGIPLKKRQASDSAKTDISILMTYVSADAYLKAGGSLGFVITRTVFQSEIGGWHFRHFSLPDKTKLKVTRVDDLDRLKPFRGRAANVTASVVLRKGEKTEYPVRYVRWETVVRGTGGEDDSLAEVLSGSRRFNWVAYPVRKEWSQSSWIVGPEKCIEILRTVIAPSPYASLAREGINTRGANGVYFVDAVKAVRNQVFVRNRAHDGDEDERVPIVERFIEHDHLFPLLRGRDVGKWFATPSGAVVLPHDAHDPVEPIPFSQLGQKTQDFLTTFREKLSGRKKFRNFDPGGENWYGLYSVLQATFAPYKVVWKEMARGSVASVVSSFGVQPGSDQKVVIPDHKLMIIPAVSSQEAHFIAAILNSSVARYIVVSFAISTGISTHILEKLPIPKFDVTNPLHTHLAELSSNCHRSASKADEVNLREAEIAIDNAVGKLWGMTTDELITIQTTLREFEGTEEEEA